MSNTNRWTPGRTKDLLRAARELLIEGGVAAVTIEAVAERAGASKPTLYRRWRDRWHLAVDAAKDSLQLIDVSDLGSFEEEFRALLITRMQQFRITGNDVVLASFIGAAAVEEQVATAFHSWVADQMEATTAIVQRARQRGEIAADVDVDTHDLATIIVAPLLYRYVIEGKVPDEKFVEDLVRIMCRALGVTPRQAPTAP